MALPALAQTDSVAAQIAPLTEVARERGPVRVIVGFDIDTAPEATLSASALTGQRAAISAAQDTMASAFGETSVVREFQTIPFTTLMLDADQLARLAEMPGLSSVALDVADPPTLNTSTGRIGAPWLWRRGVNGTGWAVAVLDTGLYYGHIAFGGSVVASACFSSNNPTDRATSLCYGRVTQSTSASAARVCPDSVTGCDHGTHVASTAVGRAPTAYRGVAPRGNLIPIQVFTRFAHEQGWCPYFGVDCVLSYRSDQVAALEHVLTLSQTHQIAAVNMSLGGGQYGDACDALPEAAAHLAVINNLTAAGVAVVIASGNNGFTTSIGFPACISSAVTVGATDDSDAIASFSNQDEGMIDVMAPGVSTTAAGIGSRRELRIMSGTSMATPHVAGAFALLRQDRPNATVAQILQALRCTGTPVTRVNTVGTFPRINVDLARRQLRSGGQPGC